MAGELGRFGWRQFEIEFFLLSASLGGRGVEPQPGFGLFDATPLQEFARHIDLFFAARQDVANNDFVQFAIGEMVGVPQDDRFGVHSLDRFFQQFGELLIAERFGRRQLQRW